MMTTLRLILGDQLTHHLPILLEGDFQNDHVLMMEVKQEASHVPHHPKKIAFIFSAMRHFAEELKQTFQYVHYITLEQSQTTFTETLKAFLHQKSFDTIFVTEPSEYRVKEELQKLPVTFLPDNRFYCRPEQFQEWADGKKTLTMEFFYRMLRKQYTILMTEDGEPEGKQWNFDKENRKALPQDIEIPAPMHFTPDVITTDVLALVKKHFSNHFGSLESFWFAVTHTQAKKALTHFVKHALRYFGDYQDAMQQGEYYLFHSALSQYLNCGLLTPKEICEAVEEAYRKGEVPINCAEGYIRQILGWREFIRGIYWAFMPTYAEKNFLQAKHPLPKLYWGGETDMNCLKCVVKQTEEEATSHHIQRLMVTGNFALIAGIDPKEVCEWYLAVYADAFEWVELPNTLGMALYGDGGIVGTKPYAASGAYINRMSNYCKSCRYTLKAKSGPDACPFNVFYWDFLLRHETLFKSNPRMKFALNNLKHLSHCEKGEIHQTAKNLSNKLFNPGETDCVRPHQKSAGSHRCGQSQSVGSLSFCTQLRPHGDS
ncbi:MAG: cryptochrome/photolyase family protein, partial [Chlamydiia bacterium]|nr:cryptochrome/photolyase family protein [Chlamydiia bacterium]